MAFWQHVVSPGEILGQAGDAGAWRGELWGEQNRGVVRGQQAALGQAAGAWKGKCILG